MKKRLSFIACLLAAGLVWAAAGAKQDVTRLLRKTVDDVLAVIRDKSLSRQAMKDGVMAVVSPVFDFELMGKLSLGRKYWPKLNNEQRREYLDLFVKQLQTSYLDKVSLVSDEKVLFEDPVEKGDKIYVTTRVASKKEPIKLLYKFYLLFVY